MVFFPLSYKALNCLAAEIAPYQKTASPHLESNNWLNLHRLSQLLTNIGKILIFGLLLLLFVIFLQKCVESATLEGQL